ncbi:DEAD/DEAH box helicase [Catalinimonas niigatensis]|uniref:DEAD/DEAH box helicase n=1 Tax=Catalinimonas niigatensis TaxID=1397264 RepID=UPI0026656BEF|nr:DEAD/DEAH box helicase [Catalinimonas niigatensis]WPP49247.1 DEAD/DEAH box helicase [Catalinimonas niigatensis]
MQGKNKDIKAILDKLGIAALNPMQESAYEAISSQPEVVLLSPTGTGKTLAFLLPLIAALDPELTAVQALILVPSRELALQIEQVTREMGSGFKTNAVYGGRAGAKDKLDLKHPPAILIGTPGRIADHMRRGTIATDHIKTLVLDEFDKSLEVGFADEMSAILSSLRSVKKKVLTSATQKVKIPAFMGIRNPKYLNFPGESSPRLQLKTVLATNKNTLETLVQLLRHLGGKNGIVFCNLKESIQTVSDYLAVNAIDHSCFYGGLEQVDRERALIKFRNGTHRILIATDLAARGIDVPKMDFIIHYQLPLTEDEFVHRNGRTARMNSQGTAYMIRLEKESLPPFAKGAEVLTLKPNHEKLTKAWETLFISGGRKDKISKGDIAGLFFKQGKLSKDELGVIELKQDCAFVAVPTSKAKQLIQQLNNSPLKKKKVRISLLA